jgi:hypothetical protein
MVGTLSDVWDYAQQGGYTQTELDENGHMTRGVDIQMTDGLFGDAFGAFYSERVEQDGYQTIYRIARLKGPVPEEKTLHGALGAIEGAVFDYTTAHADSVEELYDEVQQAQLNTSMEQVMDMMDAMKGEKAENEEEIVGPTIDDQRAFTAGSKDDLDEIYRHAFEDADEVLDR